MSGWLLPFDSWASVWMSGIWRASWQGGLAILLASLLIFAFRCLPAWGKCWLWRLVYLKLIVVLFCVPAIPLRLLPATAAPADGDPVAIGDFTQADASLAPSDAAAAVQRRSLPPWPNSQFGMRWLFVAWLGGVVLNLAILGMQVRRVARLPREPLSLAWLEATIRELAHDYGLHRPPAVAVSTAAPAPLLIGLFRPTIVLPQHVVTNCSPGELRQIASHELGHLRRADLWWNLLPAVVQVVFFFHPLVWLAHRRWRLTREMACDEFVLAHSSRRRDYARALVRVAALCSQRVQLACGAGSLSIFESSSSLKWRLIAMKRFADPSIKRSLLFAGCLVGAAIAGVVPWQLTARATDGATRVDGYGSNMGFESVGDNGRAESWGGGGRECALTLDPDRKRSGKFSARLVGLADGGAGSYTQCIAAEELRGKRVALSGYLRTKDVDGLGAGFWMRIDGQKPSLAFDNMNRRRVTGTSDWRQYRVVLDVPVEATKICFGFLLQGKGTAWADDLRLAAAGEGDKPPGGGNAPAIVKLAAPSNTGFESATEKGTRPANWGGGGEGYERRLDHDDPHSGQACAHLKSLKPDTRFATFVQGFKVGEFAGKRVKCTAYLKTKDAERAGLWMRVDGEQEGRVKPLSFDNMQNRPVTGTTDWSRRTLILDVPEGAVSIDYGFLLIGGGEAWADDFHFEALSPVK